MSRPRAESSEMLSRLWAYAARAEATPITPADIDAWLLSLSGLNDFEGKTAQRAICVDLLKHADDDDMLDRDRAICAAVITRLTEELDATPESLRVRRRAEYLSTVAALAAGDDEDDL